MNNRSSSHFWVVGDRETVRRAEALLDHSIRLHNERPDSHHAAQPLVVDEGENEFELASRLTRLARAVDIADRGAAQGIGEVVDRGVYSNPELHWSLQLPEAAVLMIKPGIRVSETLVIDLAERLAECGYSVTEGRRVSAEEIRGKALIRRHYGAHWRIAQTGYLWPAERVRMRQLYDSVAFRELELGRLRTLPVVGAGPLVESWGVPQRVVDEWTELSAAAHGVDTGHVLANNRVGDLTYVHLMCGVDSDIESCFVINSQMNTVTSWWENSATGVYVFLVRAVTERAVPWSRMRREFQGEGRVDNWPIGSLRRDIKEGVIEAEYDDNSDLTMVRNAVHLSNGPIEAFREACIWFDRQPTETALGRAVRDELGIAPEHLLASHYGVLGARADALVDLTRGMSIGQVLAELRTRRLVTFEDLPPNEESLTRVDDACDLVGGIIRSSGARGMYLAGEAALNVASGRSPLELRVVGGVPTKLSLDLSTIQTRQIVNISFTEPGGQAEGSGTVDRLRIDLGDDRQSAVPVAPEG